jgi:hypothetical protein
MAIRFGRAMGQPPVEWRLIVESYWCRDCDAGPGTHCITRNLHPKGEPHMSRVNDVARCPRCNAWVHAEWPELLCPRCDMLVSRRHRDED